MAECFRLEPYDGLEDWNYAWVDDEDYKSLRHYPWTDDATFDDNGNQARVSQVFYRENGEKYFLHRAVWELHEDTLGSCEGKRFGWLDKDPRRCTKDNLFIWEPGAGNRKIARIKKLTELHHKGVNVSKLTRMFVCSKRDSSAAERTKTRALARPIVRIAEDPKTFDTPAGAPTDIKAIRTVNDTLVYVDAKLYEQLAQYDWRDTGDRVIRGLGWVIERLAQVVLGSDPKLLVGYIDGVHTHCWKDNLFAYEKGLANRRASRRAAIAAMATLKGTSDDQR